MVMRQDPEGYARNYEALANAVDPGPVSPSLPLLLIDGADDGIRDPDLARRVAQTHGRAAVEVLGGVGHWIAVEAARRCTDFLVSFLASSHLNPTHAPD
jgi:3-oxoadipate enol-lactonase